MKQKIGIIVAMQEELNELMQNMKIEKINKIYEVEFIEVNISNKECVIVKCGIGKVNSSRVTQIMIDKYNVEYIVNIGTAGSINEELEIGDLVIATNLVQHDFDITAFGHEKGYITDVGKRFQSDQRLIEKAKTTVKKIDGLRWKLGTIASGDIFCTDINMKRKIRSEFNAECVEMEGASIAQVCTLDNIPFIVIRDISDKPNGHNNIDFDKYLAKVSKTYAQFIDIFIN